MPLKTLYRGILKGLKTYPSIKRKELREAAILEFRDGKALKEKLDITKGYRKARIAYAHIMLYNARIGEIYKQPTKYKPSDITNLPSFNTSRDDPEFVYF